MADSTDNQLGDQPDDAPDGGEGGSIARPLLALGLAAGAVLLAYLLAKHLLAIEQPQDRAERLVRTCESLLDQVQESLAQLHKGAVATPDPEQP